MHSNLPDEYDLSTIRVMTFNVRGSSGIEDGINAWPLKARSIHQHTFT